MVQLIEREEAHAGIIRLRAEDAIQLDGVANRLVNLQAELRTVENQIELALGTLVGPVQSDGLFGDARGVFQKLQFVHQLVAFQLMLSAEGVRIGTLLNLAVTKAERGETGATCVTRLIDETAD